MMAKFEDQLFDDLMRNHGSALDDVPDRAGTGARRGIGRAVGIGGTALGVAGVIALTSTLLTGGAPAAYAVTTGADGTVTVSITDLSGVAGANEELRELGVRAVAVPVRDECVALDSLPIEIVGMDSTVDQGAASGPSVTFDAQSIPEGATLLLAAAPQPNGVSLGAEVIKGSAPDCVSLSAPPVRGPQGRMPGLPGQEVRPGSPAEGTAQNDGN